MSVEKQEAGEWSRCGSDVASFEGTRVALVGKVISSDASSATVEAHDGGNVQIARSADAGYASAYVQVIGMANADGTVREEISASFGDDFGALILLRSSFFPLAASLVGLLRAHAHPHTPLHARPLSLSLCLPHRTHRHDELRGAGEDVPRQVQRFVLDLKQAISSNAYQSQQHEANLLRLHLRGAPVVEVVLQVAVTDAELELLEELAVVHDVQRVEDIDFALKSRRGEREREGGGGRDEGKLVRCC